MSDRVAVVLVAWNSARHLGDAVASVPGDVPVVVVDNASTDGSAEVARRARPTAIVVASDRNLGFGPACNLGARTVDSETILFLNPDAALVDGRASLDALLAALDADAGLAAVAPRLLGEGQEAFQLRKLPTFGSLFREAFLLNRLFPRNPWLARERYRDRPRDQPFDVEQPAAAALLVRRSAFEAVGGFDERFVPAWFEDVDLCARLLQSGRRIRYVPAARATHVGGVTMRALPYRDYLPLYTRNLLIYLAAHGSPLRTISVRLVLALGALLRLVLLSVTEGDHARGDAAVAYLRVIRGTLGLGFRSALI